MSWSGLLKRRKGARKVCGCTVEQTRTGRPSVKCRGKAHRFVSRKEGLKLLARERAQGSFCIFITGKRRAKKAKRRRR